MKNSITAYKNGKQATFTKMVWEGMGKNKNGWTLKEDKTVLKVEAPSEYEKLIGQADGFKKDGKNEEALTKYNEALKLQETPALKTKITKLTKAIEKAKADEAKNEIDEFIKSAEEAEKDGDLKAALEFYEAALGLNPEMKKLQKLVEKTRKAIEAEEPAE